MTGVLDEHLKKDTGEIVDEIAPLPLLDQAYWKEILGVIPGVDQHSFRVQAPVPRIGLSLVVGSGPFVKTISSSAISSYLLETAAV